MALKLHMAVTGEIATTANSKIMGVKFQNIFCSLIRCP